MAEITTLKKVTQDYMLPTRNPFEIKGKDIKSMRKDINLTINKRKLNSRY